MFHAGPVAVATSIGRTCSAIACSIADIVKPDHFPGGRVQKRDAKAAQVERGVLLARFWHRSLAGILLTTGQAKLAIPQYEQAIQKTTIQGYVEGCPKPLAEARAKASGQERRVSADRPEASECVPISADPRAAPVFRLFPLVTFVFDSFLLTSPPLPWP